MRKQAKLMEFGLNYQRFADYQDKMLVVEISYYNVLFHIYQIIVPASPFSGPNSSDIRRRGVVVRASSAARPVGE